MRDNRSITPVRHVDSGCGGDERAIEGPQGDATEFRGGQEVQVDVVQAAAHQVVGFEEGQDFLVGRDGTGAEGLEQFENLPAVLEIAAGIPKETKRTLVAERNEKRRKKKATPPRTLFSSSFVLFGKSPLVSLGFLPCDPQGGSS
jgi:hypothetical protein